MPSREFGFAGRPFARVTADGDTLGWLAELLEPALASADGAGDWTVDVLDPAPPRSPGMAGERSLACFVLDQSTLSLPAWRDGQGYVVHDAERGCQFTVDAARVTLTPFADGGRRWRFTLALIIYELVATRARQHQLELHGAAVAFRGQGMLILGPKNAGKTTLALHLQRGGGCQAIANDRAFVTRSDDELTVLGLPTVIKVRPGTTEGLPELQAGRPWLERPYLYSIAELSQSSEAWPGEEELSLTPAQVVARLGSDRTSGAPVDALVFPRVDPAVQGISIQRLPANSVRALVALNRFGAPGRPPVVFERLEGAGGSSPDALLEALSVVPAFRIDLGAHAYDDPHFKDRVLAGLEMA